MAAVRKKKNERKQWKSILYDIFVSTLSWYNKWMVYNIYFYSTLYTRGAKKLPLGTLLEIVMNIYRHINVIISLYFAIAMRDLENQYKFGEKKIWSDWKQIYNITDIVVLFEKKKERFVLKQRQK